MSQADTVFALSSGQGPAGVAVLRLSGPAALDAAARLTGNRLPAPRRAALRRLYRPDDNSLLDTALVLAFPAPASFTGEDMAELHCHGGRAIIAAVTAALLALGLRPAQAGEFSRRAFMNGRLDLTAAEGLADMIAAETEAQRVQALRQAGGALATLYDDWRARLIEARALIEATLDFADEEVPDNLFDRVRPALARLAEDIARHLADARRGERLRDGLQIAVIGPPNSGKSSLINALAKRDAAIVSDIPGTTRDVIEVHLDLAGYPVTIADTAGLRAGGDPLEAEGMRRARARAAAADLKLILGDARKDALDPALEALIDDRAMVLYNKLDLREDGGRVGLSAPAGCLGAWAVSAKTGAGLDAWLAALAAWAARHFAPSEAPAITRARHRQALEAAQAALARALEGGGDDVVLAAEDLRLASDSLGRITGRVDVEEVLDVIFAQFCIGK